jgi:hypothetical protein
MLGIFVQELLYRKFPIEDIPQRKLSVVLDMVATMKLRALLVAPPESGIEEVG